MIYHRYISINNFLFSFLEEAEDQYDCELKGITLRYSTYMYPI